MRHRLLIKLAKVVLVLAAFYVTMLLGYAIGFSVSHHYIPVGLLQAILYVGIVTCIYMLVKDKLWAKRRES